MAAREKGVKFDLGHGQGSFVWNVAEAAARANFFPDSLSSDLHVASVNGPAYDMPTCMTKYLMLGLPLADVIAGATSQPAAMLGRGWDEKIGSLGVGRGADICILELEECDAMLEDCLGQVRHCSERLVCRAVWRDGVPARVTEEPVWPNPESQAWQAQGWSEGDTRDAERPPLPDPAVLQRVQARQEHLRYLAGAAVCTHTPASLAGLHRSHGSVLAVSQARMGGDCNPNMPAYLSPAAVGHVSRWFALPWCADSRAVAQATLPAPPADGKEEAECGDKKKAPIKMATRNLLAFPATP